ncbi:hypothetical protein Nazgul12 [Burkholderia phage BcepNazgul]|uniref:Uncharacterized protein n=1 Tax=Burkholderia phage BcepNazgul TaxID=242861 RepID=Q2HPF6_9CAUD|nr:hypothetical protein Nazgul12 [Burkholderia phage BcepNazgul]ABD46771.1 hypothetical protein Nazgul12 [Burkholderia phage BcepNazgul]
MMRRRNALAKRRAAVPFSAPLVRPGGPPVSRADDPSCLLWGPRPFPIFLDQSRNDPPHRPFAYFGNRAGPPRTGRVERADRGLLHNPSRTPGRRR